MNWRSIKLNGAVSISRVVGVYEIGDMRVPSTKYKVKVLSSDFGGFIAMLNVACRDSKGMPNGCAGLGQSELEALQDAIVRFGDELGKRSAWSEEDFEWSDPSDF